MTDAEIAGLRAEAEENRPGLSLDPELVLKLLDERERLLAALTEAAGELEGAERWRAAEAARRAIEAAAR